MVVVRRGWLRDSRITPSLILGTTILIVIVLTAVVGPLLVNQKMARVGGVGPNLEPSSENWFGTDSQGRDVFTTLIMATPSTLSVGLVAGLLSVIIGLALGLLAGFFGGLPDATIRVFSDVLIAVPSLAFMILVVSRMGRPNIMLVAVIVGCLTWSGTARGIRSQVLSIRERSYTLVANANGESALEVLFREVMPNLLPLIMASFIGAVTAGIFTVMSLEVLGLGNNVIPTLGMMIFWSQRFSAVLRSMWWWWSPPIITIASIFIGLYLVSSGLDRFVNPNIPVSAPRQRRRWRSKQAETPLPAEQTATAGGPGAGLLEVKHLQVEYRTARGVVKAVD